MTNIAHPLGQSPEVYAVIPNAEARELAAMVVREAMSADPGKYAEDQKINTQEKIRNAGRRTVSLASEPQPNWQDEANCLGVDPDLFFPERGASTREAKEVCRGCPVRLDCLEYALVNGEKFGIWGGLSERERRRLRRQRAQASRQTA